MSAITHKKHNVIGEFRLKLAYVWRYVSDIMDLLSPSAALPKYKTALGFKQTLKYEKMREQKSMLLGLILGPITLLGGGYMLDHNAHDPTAYFMVIWGISISILIGWTIHIKNEEQDKKLENTKIEFDEKIANLRREINEKFEKIRTEQDDKKARI